MFTSWKNRTLFSICQAGLVNNLNDGLAWGLLPLFFAAHGLSIAQIGLLAGISDVVHPNWRASAVGVYRLWRDSGYAIGALMAGVLADLFGALWAIGIIGGATFLSGIVVQGMMKETLSRRKKRSS